MSSTDPTVTRWHPRPKAERPDAIISTYAQTNIQLYTQLRRAGYSEMDIVLVRRAYELACGLFTGMFRASGKPFLAHLVGTASILGCLGLPPACVAAGLLHAAYREGEFGDGTRGITEEKRGLLRDAVGEEVEGLVGGYAALRWNDDTILTISDALAGLVEAEDREVLLLRLANELEHHLDLGVLYSDVERREHYLSAARQLCVDMAERLGYQRLAVALATAFEATRSGEVPGSLRTAHRKSFILPPRSHCPRPSVLLRRLSHRLRRLIPRLG